MLMWFVCGYRFGSFEIFKPTDSETGRTGPSVGRNDLLTQMLDYTVKTFYPEVARTLCPNCQHNPRYVTSETVFYKHYCTVFGSYMLYVIVPPSCLRSGRLTVLTGRRLTWNSSKSWHGEPLALWPTGRVWAGVTGKLNRVIGQINWVITMINLVTGKMKRVIIKRS